MENNGRERRGPDPRAWLFLLLAFNLAFKLLLLFNTNSFAVSEAGSNYNFLKAIEHGAHPALFEAGYRSTLGYIGYFFKSLFGTLVPFFWFQALLGTLAVYFLYLVCLKITRDDVAALFAVVLATLSMDYHLLTPVFYYQVFEIFFTLLAAFIVLAMIDGARNERSAAVLLLPAVVYLSMFFRGTLSFFWTVPAALALYFLWRKEYGAFVRLAAAGVITLLLFSLLPLSHFRNRSVKSVNDFKFYGHTLYGGDGGEGTFIYKENEARYQKRLAEFMSRRHYDKVTPWVRNEFQSGEIREFILKTPHKWLWLQVRKVAYTFGIVPIRDSLELLVTGKLPLKWQLAALVIQVPYVVTLLLVVILAVLFFQAADFRNTRFFFLFLLLLYLVAATCLYGHYQERYRQVVIMAALLPLAAFYFARFRARSAQKIARKRVVLLFLVLAVLIAHWGYQAYDVLVIHQARYVNAIRQF